MNWDGTAQGATPIINYLLSIGLTARYHDKENYGIDEIVIDSIRPVR